ncbi:MAG: hypothetical protein WBV11_01725 [Salegentibacter sp.]
MKLHDSSGLLQKVPQQTQDKKPEGLCPVCWGYQEYDCSIRVLMEDKQIDVNNHQRSYMRIQKLLKYHIEGARLKKSIIKKRPRCNSAKAEK